MAFFSAFLRHGVHERLCSAESVFSLVRREAIPDPEDGD
jgi:hypothetical protein